MAVLAIDLGASSGRGVIVELVDKSVRLEEVHRFYNGAKEIGKEYFWDADSLIENIKKCVKNAVNSGVKIESLAIDTWGVDYAFIKKDGGIYNLPHSYRDPRTSGIIDKFSAYTKEDLYALAGISLNEFNTTYQLSTEKGVNWGDIDCFLFMPGLFSYCLTDKMGAEPTIASTSGFYNKSGFSLEFLDRIGLPRHIVPQVYKTGTVLGNLSCSVKKELNLPYDIPVVLGAGHDTACAVASVPSTEGECLYISSGTWSLFGTELDAPIVSSEAMNNGYTNEQGVEKVRFLKNILGLWLIQECKKEWEKDVGTLSFDDIVAESKKFHDSALLINIEDSCFIAPGDMPKRIVDYVKRTQGVVVTEIGEIAQIIYQSLSMEYRYALEGLVKITGKRYEKINVIGGGAKNSYLNQLTADALGIAVVAGPVEATAIGNALVQFVALGVIKDIREGRELIKNLSDTLTFLPCTDKHKDDLYKKYLQLKKAN